VDLVKGFPFEYMHLICLGVTRKLVKLWIRGRVQVFRLAPKLVIKISKKLVALGKCLPLEFNRKQRSLSEIDRWKATEWRSFLLYTGPVALKKYLPEKHFKLFMCLSVSVRILASKAPGAELLDYADSLLSYFVEEFKVLYGKVNVSYNVHGLVHLTDDVRHLGSLDSFSAFKYENKLGVIKNLLRKPECSLVQIHRRLHECSFLQNQSPNIDLNSPQVIYSRGVATQVKFKNFQIKTQTNNDILQLHDGKIVKVQEIVHEHHNKVKLRCKSFRQRQKLFNHPCDSTVVSIEEIHIGSLSEQFSVTCEQIKQKCVLFILSPDIGAVFPLLH